MAFSNESSSLEQHLKLICDNDIKYSKLYATWELDKRVFKDVLSAINYNFPHYSMHDASHAESIINKIEMVLGKKRISELGPSETWMILQSAQLHDFGMVLQDDYVKEVWRGDEFQSFLEKVKDSSIDDDLKNAAEYIYMATNENYTGSYTSNKDWPIELRRGIVQLVAEYFRSKHADLSKKSIQHGSSFGLDFTHNGLIPSRLINLLGEIAQIHGKSFNDVLKLEFQANGVGTDIIHPRFISCLLRLGDLLDMDNGRFNPFLNMAFGKMPMLSAAHVRKHGALEHFLVTSDRIEIIADCPDDLSYRETRRWCDWIVEEIKLLAVNWLQITPIDFPGSPPRIGKMEVLLKGRKNSSEIGNLQFNISPTAAFELLEGANIYKNKLAFVRELYQNALDATKIRLWQDLNDGYYSHCTLNWRPGEELLPYHFKDLSFLDNYKIRVDIQFDDSIGLMSNENPTIVFSIKDRGTGISDLDLKNMGDTGKSWGDRPQWNDLIKSMPRWLRPTGDFGIGLQAVFSVTDTLTVYTKAEGEIAKEITLYSKRNNRYISVTNVSSPNVILNRGTKMVVNFQDDKLGSIRIGECLEQQLKETDYFSINISQSVYAIIDLILECTPSLFPTGIYVNGEIFRDVPGLDFSDIAFEAEEIFTSKNNGTPVSFKYKLASDLSHIILFENELQSIIRIQFPINKTEEISSKQKNFQFKFKGINAKFPIFFEDTFFSTSWDVLGMKTKECLTLNRESVQDNEIVLKKFYSIFNAAVRFSARKLADKLIDQSKFAEIIETIDFYQLSCLFGKYLFLDKQEDRILIKTIEDRCKLHVRVAVKRENKFVIEQLPLNEIFTDFQKVAFYVRDIPPRQEESILKFLNHKENNLSFFKYLILDTQLKDYYSRFPTTYIKVIFRAVDVKYEYLYLTRIEKTPTLNESPIYITVADETTKKYILKEIKDDNRGLLPPLKDYNQLIVKRVPFEFMFYLHTTIGYRWNLKIISPLTKDDFEKLTEQKITVDYLINSLKQRQDFIKLKQWVFDNQNTGKNNKVSIKEIEETYIELIKDIAEAIEEIPINKTPSKA